MLDTAMAVVFCARSLHPLRGLVSDSFLNFIYNGLFASFKDPHELGSNQVLLLFGCQLCLFVLHRLSQQVGKDCRHE